MPNVKDYKTENEWMSACIPVAMQEGLSQEDAKGKCFGMWQNKEMQNPIQPEQPTGMPAEQAKPEKPKGKIDFMTEIKKLLEKYGVQETDEKIIEIVNSLNVQGMPMIKRLSLIEMQMIDDENKKEILVFPRGKHYVQTKTFSGWIDFNDGFYKKIAMNFDDPALFKPYIDKDHERKESYGDITGYRIANEGMFFSIDLNNAGKEQIRNRVYRYISPTFGDTKDTKSKDHTDWLVTISLVNTPSLMGLIPELQSQLELKFNTKSKTGGKLNMELNFIGKQLGKFIELQGEVSPEAIVSALPDILKMLEELTKKVQELTGAGEKKDEQIAQQAEAMTAMSADLTKIQTEKRQKEADVVIQKAVEMGQYCCNEKFVEMKKAEYIKDPEKILKELELIPTIENQGQISLSNPGTGIDLKLTDDEIQIAKDSGFDISTPEKIKEYKNVIGG